jgi:hypothetical protein
MKLHYYLLISLFTLVNINSMLNAQTSAKELFEDESILEITLGGNLKDLLNDRSDEPKLYPISLSYKKSDSSLVNIPIQAKTRGHFRKQKGVCDYPPLLLHFTKNETLQSTLFEDQENLKLVMPCDGDEYVVREWMVYKVYNLVTPKSFRARLVRVTLEDPKRKKNSSFYGVLLEEEPQMAKRNNCVSVIRKMVPEQADAPTFINMAIFEYMIGNTDWSIQYLQNIKLLAVDSLSVPQTIPYDFDHSGLVNAPYAKPAEELEMSSVRERRYRGYCIKDMKQYGPGISLYNQLKTDIYKLYTDCKLLDPKYVKSTLQWLDEFYSTINNPQLVQRDFGYPCNKSGTGNIIIQGMKKGY